MICGAGRVSCIESMVIVALCAMLCRDVCCRPETKRGCEAKEDHEGMAFAETGEGNAPIKRPIQPLHFSSSCKAAIPPGSRSEFPFPCETTSHGLRPHRSIFRVLLSNKSRAALSSASLNPSHSLSPEDARRTISPSLAVAMAFSFFTVSVEGSARSPVRGSDVVC